MITFNDYYKMIAFNDYLRKIEYYERYSLIYEERLYLSYLAQL